MTTANSFTSWPSLRDFPLPVKVVLTGFLLAVGTGYSSALIQLHMQDSKSGEAMPTIADVILKFTGKRWYESNPPRPVSKFEKLITAPESQTFGSNGSMAAAFFSKDDDGSYNGAVKAGDGEFQRIRAEREGEQKSLALWSAASPEVREKAYVEDHFVLDGSQMPPAITPQFKSGADAVKVKAIIDARCVRCHGKDGSQSAFPLETYGQVAKYLTAPASVSVKSGGDWVKVEEPIGLEKLTQSTHAHLLSFAMLFSLTGLVFAFSSYPTALRCILGPWVLLAVFADVSLWWLARLCSDWGPYFAIGIIGTGGAVGLGLVAQIVLSLWNMYGIKGRLVLLLLSAILAGCAALIIINQVKPGLDKKQLLLKPHEEIEQKTTEAKASGPETAKTTAKAAPDPKAPNLVTAPITPVVLRPTGTSPMERVLKLPSTIKDASDLALVAKLPFRSDAEGGMVRSFFDKDPIFKDMMKDKSTSAADKEKVVAERRNELAALNDWIRLPDAERRQSYTSDSMKLPAVLKGQPFTTDYLSADKVKIKTLFADRCYRCHQSGSDAEKYPFETYDEILIELKPAK